MGSVVQQVQAEDEGNNVLEFALEPSPEEDESQPFRIDSQTGVVYLNRSLVGRAGESLFVYVTVTAANGGLPAKKEVYVNILAPGNSSNAKNYYNPRPPSFGQHATNISSLFPPFSELPGVAKKPNTGRQPLPLPPQLRPGLSDIPKNPGGFTYVKDNTQSQQPSGGGSKQNSDEGGRFDADDEDENEPPFRNPLGNGNRNKTVLIPVNTRPQYPSSFNNNNNYYGGSTGKPPADQGAQPSSGGKTEGTTPEDDSGSLGRFGPVVIAIIVLALVALAVGSVVLFRKRLCAISRSLKKKSKEEMAKKSNQSQLSNGSLSLNTLSNSLNTNLTDDSRNSMIMQQWNGPTAFNNRYVPWERDHQQMTSQFSNDSQSSQTTASAETRAEAKDPWEYPRHRLKFFNILGEGAFGQVWRCEAGEIDGKDGISTVAVKTLKENASELEKNDLVSELQVMKSLETHVNVVRLLGCCADKEPLLVIMEYVNLGKLQAYLRSSRAEK